MLWPYMQNYTCRFSKKYTKNLKSKKFKKLKKLVISFRTYMFFVYNKYKTQIEFFFIVDKGSISENVTLNKKT